MITARPLTARRIIAERIRGLLLGETGAVFSPLNLFRNGEEGFYNDIHTYATTYFEDTAGSDAAELEDTIALILDESQGPAGPELVTNGTFDTDVSGWDAFYTASGVSNLSLISFNNGTIEVDAAVANVIAEQGITTNIGSFYRFTGSVTELASGNRYWIQISNAALTSGTALIGPLTSAQDFELLFVASATTTYVQLHVDNLGDGTASFDNISVKELPGNHLTQATAGARPKLSARYNLLERTEEFDDAVWTKTNCTITANAATAPDGSMTADRVVFVSTGPSIRRTGLPAAILDGMIHLKADTPTTVNFRLVPVGSGSPVVVTCNLTTEWQDFTNTINGSASSVTSIQFWIDGFTADFYIWGADLRLASDTDQPAYQRVTTATDYDSEGFDPYLQFDLVDDALTATIPAITGGTLVLATRDGIWIDDDINASAGTFSIGPTTYTGGPAGILSVIGNKLIGPPLLLDRQLTASEKNAVVQWFQSRGAGALYVLGEELWVDSAVTVEANWLDNGDGSYTHTPGVEDAIFIADAGLNTGDVVIFQFGVSLIAGTIDVRVGGTAAAAFSGALFLRAMKHGGSAFDLAIEGNSGFEGSVSGISARQLTQPGA